jgi:cell division protein FtsL
MVVALALLLVVGAAAFQVHQFSRLTTAGYEINDLNRIRAEKQAQNHELEAEVARLSSLARVDWEARTRLQLQPAQRRLYLEVNHPVPDRQTLPTRFLPPEAPEIERGDEAWWRLPLKLLPLF